MSTVSEREKTKSCFPTSILENGDCSHEFWNAITQNFEDDDGQIEQKRVRDVRSR